MSGFRIKSGMTLEIIMSDQNPTPVVEEHTKGKYTVKVIRDKCISAGSCVAIAPGTFKLDEEGIAVILSQTGDDPETQLLGAQSCPTAAVEIIDNETGEKVWPLN